MSFLRRPPFPARSALVLLALFSSLSVQAQWQWMDSTGRKVFSDTAPPASVPEKSILKRPGAAPVAAASPAAATDAAKPEPAKADAQLEARKKEAENAEAAKKKAEADRLAKARAEVCTRAQQNRAALQSGQRIATVNAQGEREFMSDDRRASELRRLEGIIRTDCAPAAQ
ncbi:DUF4124 domain-containing protein [Hydrogenophaga sp.]|uniref:DUF4124 domain-containing protein n=1 Tax=Hydrogenophaga sp. TaxID=1904254 RepID=UPI0035B089CC